MPVMSLLLNVLWIVCGGAYMAVAWIVAAFIMAITIVGLPWTRAAFNIALYTLLPFGQKAVSRAQVTGAEDLGTSLFGVLGNIIWLVLAGWWLALGHLITAFLLMLTIIGIPFAWAHLKLAGIALWPIGKVPTRCAHIWLNPHGSKRDGISMKSLPARIPRDSASSKPILTATDLLCRWPNFSVANSNSLSPVPMMTI